MPNTIRGVEPSGIPLDPPTQTPAPVAAQNSHGRRVLKAVAIVVTLQLVFVFFFVYPGRSPHPNGLRIGVVGTAQQIDAVQRQLAPDLTGATLVEFSSAAKARTAIEGRDIYGAFVFDGQRERLISASAASFAVSALLTQAAAAAGVASVQDVVPLPSGDPRGGALNLMIIPLVVTGLLGSQLVLNIIGPIAFMRRLWTVALIAVATAAAVMTLIGPVLDVLPGPLLAEGAVLALAGFGLLTVGGGLIRLIGTAALGIGFAVFLMLGSPASGAASAPELLPTPWAQVGGWLTPGALGNGLRSLAYFDGAHITEPLAALAGIALIGIALEALAERRIARARPAGS